MSRVASEELASSLNEVTVRAGLKLRRSFWGLGRTCANTMGHEQAWLLFLVRVCVCAERGQQQAWDEVPGTMRKTLDAVWDQMGKHWRIQSRRQKQRQQQKLENGYDIAHKLKEPFPWGNVRKSPTPPYKLQ